MLIVLSGLPGTGKSLLAAGIAYELRMPVLSVDPIESAMIGAGLARSFETGLAAYRAVEAIADSQLALGQGAIVDAVNAVDEAKAMWPSLARKHGAVLKIIECTCSDVDLHRARLQARRRGLVDGIAPPSWEDVERRRLEYTTWREPLLVVDALAPAPANVARALAWLDRQDRQSR